MDQRRRLQLHEILCAILGSRNVYFQPPPTIKMVYPCIRYERDYMETFHADNAPYSQKKRYLITVIDPNPDNETSVKVAKLSLCVFDRFYAQDGLNHDVYKLYF